MPADIIMPYHGALAAYLASPTCSRRRLVFICALIQICVNSLLFAGSVQLLNILSLAAGYPKPVWNSAGAWLAWRPAEVVEQGQLMGYCSC